MSACSKCGTPIGRAGAVLRCGGCHPHYVATPPAETSPRIPRTGDAGSVASADTQTMNATDTLAAEVTTYAVSIGKLHLDRQCQHIARRRNVAASTLTQERLDNLRAIGCVCEECGS